MLSLRAWAILLVAAPVASPPAPAKAGPPSRPTALTSLWRDAPQDPSRVRIEPVAGVTEPSDLLLYGGSLYTISDSFRRIYRLDLNAPDGTVTASGSWEPSGLPAATDLEAMAALPGGEVLLASETTGVVFVLSPFPRHACAAWHTGIEGTCFFGRANCGLEAMAVLPGGRLFVAKERDPRAAYLFDLPRRPCAAATLRGRTYLKLPGRVGPDISAATYDPASGHLLLVARSRQRVLEFEVPASSPSAASSGRLIPVGEFSYAATEDRLDYEGIGFHQVEGIAVDDQRVLFLIVDNNQRRSRAFGDRRAGLLRFFPATGPKEAEPDPPIAPPIP